MTSVEIAPSIHLDVFSHHVKVSRFNHVGKVALLDYCMGMAQFGMVRVGRGRFERKMVRVFVAVTKDRSEFRFHINQLKDLLQHLGSRGFTQANMRITHHELYQPVECEFRWKDDRVARDYQVPIIDYLVEPGRSKVVTLQTGKGKSFIALQAVMAIGQRAMLVIKGMYVDKWIEDVEDSYHLKKGELMVVRGAAHLKLLIELAQAGELTAKFIICTSKTIFNYMKTYETFNGQWGDGDVYGAIPEKLYETLGVGVRIIDEVHQDFHCNFRQDLYSHVPKTIALSATLDSDDPTMNRIYELTWPLATRAPAMKYDKFIVMKALWYSLNRPNKIRCTNAMKQYSHTKFEQSLMKDPEMLHNYMSMIADIVVTSFVRVYEPGQRMLIFCATVELCTQLTAFLAERNRDLKVSRYVMDDEYEQLLTSDISVSTLLSAGTAVDIPNLRVTLMTTALSSKQANIQALGRTRRLKDWPTVTPEFLFLSAREIDKHVQYTRQKAEKLDGKVLSYKEYQTPYRI